MWVIPLVVMFFVWSCACAVFAFVEPRGPFQRFVPRRIWFVFAFLPEPWDRRVGLLFNAAAGFAASAYFAYTGLLSAL